MSQAWKGTKIKLNNAAAKKATRQHKETMRKGSENKSISEQEWNWTQKENKNWTKKTCPLCCSLLEFFSQLFFFSYPILRYVMSIFFFVRLCRKRCLKRNKCFEMSWWKIKANEVKKCSRKEMACNRILASTETNKKMFFSIDACH